MTTIPHSAHLAIVLEHFQKPINDMLEIGIYREPHSIPGGIPAVTNRKIARRICGELRRPFILLEDQMGWWMQVDGRWERNPDPQWVRSILVFPKQKRLMPLVSSLLMAAPEYVRQKDYAGTAPLFRTSHKSKWGFVFNDRALLDEYLAAVRTDPDMRKVFGLEAK
jgi:hypothetical protein